VEFGDKVGERDGKATLPFPSRQDARLSPGGIEGIITGKPSKDAGILQIPEFLVPNSRPGPLEVGNSQILGRIPSEGEHDPAYIARLFEADLSGTATREGKRGNVKGFHRAPRYHLSFVIDHFSFEEL